MTLIRRLLPQIQQPYYIIIRNYHRTNLLFEQVKSQPKINEKKALLDIDESAIKQILKLQKRDNNPNQNLKIIIESGGCHGFKLIFDLTDKLEEDEMIIEKDGAKVVVNKAFLPLISGSKVTFTEELIGSQFKLMDNPNAASGCGCGISFELK